MHKRTHTPKNGIAGSQGDYTFSTEREHQIIFRSSDTNLYFHPQCLRDPVSPHLCQPWYCQSFLFCSSGGCEVVSICISLITKGLVCLFIDHLDMVFCDMPIHFFSPFLFSVVCLIDS